MLNKLIKYCIENAFITLVIFGVITVLSLAENQVVVMTRWPGQTPTNIENQVTYPITI